MSLRSAGILLIGLLLAIGSARADGPVIELAWHDSSFPFSFLEDGEVRGILPEIVHGVVRTRMGMRVDDAAYPWARAQKMVRDGVHDAMVTNATPARREYASAASEILYTARVVPLTRRGSPVARALLDDPTVDALRTLRVCHGKASGWHAAFAARHQLETFGVTSSTACVRMIHRGRMDVTIYAEDMLLWDVRNLQLQDDMRVVDAEFGVWDLKLMLSNKSTLDQSFLSAFDRAVAAMKADGSFDALLREVRRRYR